jgi:hypothetical protein
MKRNDQQLLFAANKTAFIDQLRWHENKKTRLV